METPTPRNQPLFDHMAQDHGLTLTVSECDEIEHIVARMLANDRRLEAERRASSELRSGEWVEELGAALCLVSGLLKNHEREMARGTMASLAMAEVALEKAVETERSRSSTPELTDRGRAQ